MWGVDVAHPVVAQVDHLAVGERQGGPVGHVVERHHAPEGSVGHLGFGGGGEELVHGTALVRLDMTEGDPAQPFERGDGGDGRGDQREQLSRSGVEQQGCSSSMRY